MKYKFATQPLLSGLYEPEGIYLSTPFEGSHPVSQFWGQHPEQYGQFNYNGVRLKGHNGIDFAMPPGTNLIAVDAGRVMEISFEPGGFGRYIKLEHRWGESFYAHIGNVHVEAGQRIKRNELIAVAGPSLFPNLPPHLHFSIRIAPYNRFDGWGGFSDPLPFLNPANIVLPDDSEDQEGAPTFLAHPMAQERQGMRRP
jgi:murein DD-endopeptidase MepM/ murein hydrolase activator NlpD